MLFVGNKCFVALNFLANIDEPARKALIAKGTTSTYRKKQYIFNAGDNDRRVYILRRGRVKIVQASPIGREVLLWFCVPGELFGITECLDEKPRPVSAVALDTSDVLSLECEWFRQWLEDNPKHATHLVSIMATRLREIGHRFLNLATGNVTSQVAKLLVEMANCYGTQMNHGVLLNIPLSHQDIADMIGVSRQRVSATISQLKQQGLLSIRKHFLCLEKLTELAQLAGVHDALDLAEPRRARKQRRN